jgi:hypothetical protein
MKEAPMRALSLAAVVALAAAPAIAQDAVKNPQQKPATSAVKPQMSTVSPQTSTVSREAQEKLREALQRAGFRDIRIVDATYVIHARTQDGNFVVMYVNPSDAGADSTTTGEARTETPPAPEAPVVDRADAHLQKYDAETGNPQSKAR